MKSQISFVDAVLQSKRFELLRSIRSQSSQLNVGEGEHDTIDRIQGMSRREEVVTFVDALTRTLAAVNAALLAVKHGSYGMCAECGEPISSRRLEAIPWASHCIVCQEVLDRQDNMRVASPDWDQAA
jgi:DnaK suppressor protein